MAVLDESPFGFSGRPVFTAKPGQETIVGTLEEFMHQIAWRNARKGYLGVNFGQLSIGQKVAAIGRIILVFGWMRSRKKLPLELRRLRRRQAIVRITPIFTRIRLRMLPAKRPVSVVSYLKGVA